MAERIKLTPTERLILKNQYAILEFLCKAFPKFTAEGNVIYHEASTYHRYQEILSHGYEMLISEMTEGIYDIDLSYEEQREILDILDMYNDLQWSFDELKDKGDLTESDVHFPGWDGNSPKGELSFAKLFCYRGEDSWADPKKVKPDRFERVRPSPAYNGHGPWLDGYRRMLRVFLPFKQRLVHGQWRSFTVDEIHEILDAFAHPDSPRGREVAEKKLKRAEG